MALEVLIVDDEADIRELVSGVLEDEGYAVRTAADSTQTLDAVEERRPSMVLLDVWLQGSKLDGLQLLQEIKRRADDPPVESAREGSLYRALRGNDEPGAGRGGIVRQRERGRNAPRPARTCPRRNPVPRRDCRHAVDDSGQNPARAHGPELHA